MKKDLIAGKLLKVIQGQPTQDKDRVKEKQKIFVMLRDKYNFQKPF